RSPRRPARDGQGGGPEGPVGAGGGAPGGPAARPAPAPQRPPRPEHARGRGALARGPGNAGPDRPPGEVGHAPRGVRDGSGAAADLRAAASGRARKVAGMLTFLPAPRAGSAGSPDSPRAWRSRGGRRVPPALNGPARIHSAHGGSG